MYCEIITAVGVINTCFTSHYYLGYSIQDLLLYQHQACNSIANYNHHTLLLTPRTYSLMRRVDSLEKTLMLGGIGGRRRRGRQRMRWVDGITDSMDVNLSWWWTGRPGVLRFMGSQRVGHDWATDLIWCVFKCQECVKKDIFWKFYYH